MVTAAGLKERTRDDLAQMAKRKGVTGWYSMRKDQLVRALLRLEKKNGSKRKKAVAAASTKKAKSPKVVVRKTSTRGTAAKTKAARNTNGKGKTNGVGKANGAQKANGAKKAKQPVKVTSPKAARKIRSANEQREQLKDLSTSVNGGKNGHAAGTKNGNGRKKPRRDRVVLMVRDSYWLHVCWEIRPRSIERVRAAMCEMWHTAKPTLRLLQVDGGATTSTAERVVREVEIHGGVNNWYLDVTDPPKSYRVDIGYLAANGRFHSLSRSNSVTTPRSGGADALDHNWSDVAKDYERVFALSGGYAEEVCSGDLKELFEERLRRPMGSSLSAKYGVSVGGGHSAFVLSVDAELIIYGQTKADANLTLAGQPVKLRPDGSFTVRKSMPERRQVLPIVANSRDGLEQRTVILAIERNTKVMEPITRDCVIAANGK